MRAEIHLIEFVPYAHRNERCAVGILCLHPNGNVTAHPAQSLRKARAIDPACDVEALRGGLHVVAREIQEDISALPLYAQGSPSGIVISPHGGYITYESDEDFAKQIEWALAVGVEPDRAVVQRERLAVSRLFVEIKSVFDSLGWLAKPMQSIEDHRIVPRYSIARDEGLTVDFGLRNGALHCIQTIDYRHNAAAHRIEANAKLLTLGFAKQFDPAAKGYAVIAGEDSKEARAALRLAERTSADLFMHDQPADMDRLLTILSDAMGQPALVAPQMT